MSGFLGAVSFLTRVPVGTRTSGSVEIARSVPWFPIVGTLVGIVVALAFVVTREAFGSFVGATLAVAAGTAVTGAFHEDGLGDVADAFGGGWDREQTLAIMKDPRQGTYGVIAIVVGLLLRVGAVATFEAWTALAALPAAHALSRSAAVAMMRSAPPANGSGIGAAYVRDLGSRGVALGTAIGATVAALALGVWMVPAAALAAGAALVLRRMSVVKIGGITGDVLGATQQVAEISILIGVAGAARAGLDVVWWAS